MLDQKSTPIHKSLGQFPSSAYNPLMKLNKLPSTAKLSLPAFFTVTRRPTLKSQMDEIEKIYYFDDLNPENVSDYKKLINSKGQDIPLTYLYLFAQKSQIDLMLDKRFIFSIVGLVHMDNEMESFNEVKIGQRVELKTTATQYFNQEKNRVEVNFEVLFTQKMKGK